MASLPSRTAKGNEHRTITGAHTVTSARKKPGGGGDTGGGGYGPMERGDQRELCIGLSD